MSASEATRASVRPRTPVPRRVRWFIVLLAPSAVAYGFLLVWISAYLPEIGFASSTVGLLLGANGIALVAGSIPLSLLADRTGKKRVLLVALVVFSPALVVFALTTDVSILLVAVIIVGLVDGAFQSTWNAMIADQTTPENRDHAFALSFILSSLCIGIGYSLPYFFPPIEAAFRVDSRTVHNTAMLVLGAVALVSPPAIYVLLRNQPDVPRAMGRAFRGRELRPLLKFSGINSLIGLGAGFFIPLVPTWLFLKFGVSDQYSGPVLAVASFTIAFAAIGSARLSKRFGSVRAIVMAQGLSTVFMLSLAFAPDAVSASSLYIVRATLMNMSAPLADAFLMGIVAADQRSFASAVNSLVWRLPNSVTTVVGGVLMSTGYLDLPIFLATAFYVAAVTLFFTVFRDVRPTT